MTKQIFIVSSVFDAEAGLPPTYEIASHLPNTAIARAQYLMGALTPARGIGFQFVTEFVLT